MQAARAVIAMLPNGRILWLRIGPAPISAREADRLTASIRQAYADRARGLRANIATARRFLRTVKRDAAKLNRIALRQDRTLRRRLLTGAGALHRRIETELMPLGRRARVVRQQQLAAVRSNGRRVLLDHLTLASALPLMAAYGQRSGPLTANNLAILLALLVWLFGDDLTDLLVGRHSGPAGAIRGATVWSYAAPLANLLTLRWLLSGRQHERFVTGATGLGDFTVFSENLSGSQHDLYLAQVDLSARIAPEHVADFQSFTAVPVLATIRSIEFATKASDNALELLAAEVKQGALWLSVRAMGLPPMPASSLLSQLQVDWAVDTREPSAGLG